MIRIVFPCLLSSWGRGLTTYWYYDVSARGIVMMAEVPRWCWEIPYIVSYILQNDDGENFGKFGKINVVCKIFYQAKFQIHLIT